MTWLRWYDGTCADGKFQIVSRNAEGRPADVIALWAILLEDAAHPDHRGAATRGIKFYSLILGIPEPEIETLLEGMAQLDLIELGTEITITHWNKRQFEIDLKDPTARDRKRRWRAKERSRHGSGTAGNAPSHPDTDTDTDTEAEKIRETRAKARGTRLAKGWWPTEANIQYALAHGLSLERVSTEGEKFRNYWTAKAGQAATKLDWDATWQNWILKAAEQNGAAHGNDRRRGESLGDLGRRLAAEARELEAAADNRRTDDPFRKH